MAHLSGTDRSQLLLLPEAVDDYVGPDNPVRFIEAFVDGLDLAAADFERVAAKETGRPGFDPADMLKLYIYGYINRVRSSRRLEARKSAETALLRPHAAPDSDEREIARKSSPINPRLGIELTPPEF
jgi:transposase